MLHAEDFASRPGGFVVDRIEQGDAFAPASGAETAAAPRFTDAGSGSGSATIKLPQKVRRSFF
ncbi:hypothetical protein RZS08_08605, partial [Arthrospira platensis SPKY1]|nr:hypothetical protein [Arthrospira platensis SPKY1]